MLRSLLQSSRSLGGVRGVHTRVRLPFPIESGLPGFLSPKALSLIAEDWQEGLLARLSHLTRGTPNQDLSVLQTLLKTAADPTQALTFNYASEALNNSFFLSTLSPVQNSPLPSPNSKFANAIATTPSFKSLAGLISHFSAHVAGLHPSSGAYIWLVTDAKGNLGVVGTYAGGSVLVQGRIQRNKGFTGLGVLGEDLKDKVMRDDQGRVLRDERTPIVEKDENLAVSAASSARISGKSTRGGMRSGNFDNLLSGLEAGSDMASALGSTSKDLHPLLCLSVHEHCYLTDYGVWGRKDYVENWWTFIDWTKVSEAYETIVTEAAAR